MIINFFFKILSLSWKEKKKKKQNLFFFFFLIPKTAPRYMGVGIREKNKKKIIGVGERG